MDTRTKEAGLGGRGGRREQSDPLSWWRSTDPRTVAPAQCLKLWLCVQGACLDAGLDTQRLETAKLVCLAIEGHADRDLVMSHLFLRALDGHAGAVTVVANALRRESAACARLSASWTDFLMTSRRRAAPLALPAPGPVA